MLQLPGFLHPGTVKASKCSAVARGGRLGAAGIDWYIAYFSIKPRNVFVLWSNFWAAFATKSNFWLFFEQLFEKLRETFWKILSNLWKVLSVDLPLMELRFDIPKSLERGKLLCHITYFTSSLRKQPGISIRGVFQRGNSKWCREVSSGGTRGGWEAQGPHILRPNWGLKGRKFFWDRRSLASQGLNDQAPPAYLKVWIRHWYRPFLACYNCGHYWLWAKNNVHPVIPTTSSKLRWCLWPARLNKGTVWFS